MAWMPRLVGRLAGRLVQCSRPSLTSECGQASVGVVLIALVAGSGIFGSALIAQGTISADDLNEIFSASLSRVGGMLEVRGSVIATAGGEPLVVETLQVTLGTLGNTPPIAIDPFAADGLVIAYRDAGFFSPSVPYGVRFLNGNGDDRIDDGELVLVTIQLANLAGDSAPTPRPGSRFTLELTSPAGVTLSVSRKLPAVFDPVMALP